MLELPIRSWSLLVRTDFTEEDAWQQVSAAVTAETAEGFRANVEPISDPAFAGATYQQVRAAVPANDKGAMVLFVADGTTIADPDHPVQVVDLIEHTLHGQELAPFRCIPAEVVSVENNLNIANMDWEEFFTSTDTEGVFRGFRITRRDGDGARR